MIIFKWRRVIGGGAITSTAPRVTPSILPHTSTRVNSHYWSESRALLAFIYILIENPDSKSNIHFRFIDSFVSRFSSISPCYFILFLLLFLSLSKITQQKSVSNSLSGSCFIDFQLGMLFLFAWIHYIFGWFYLLPWIIGIFPLFCNWYLLQCFLPGFRSLILHFLLV